MTDLIDVIEKAVDLMIVKCGGPGGTPGPCPGSRRKPPGAKPPKKPVASAPSKIEVKPTGKYGTVQQMDKKNPRPKIDPKKMKEAGITVKNGQLAISKSKTPRQAVLQLEILGDIVKKSPERKILALAAGVERAYSRVIVNARKQLKKVADQNEEILVDAEPFFELGE